MMSQSPPQDDSAPRSESQEIPATPRKARMWPVAVILLVYAAIMIVGFSSPAAMSNAIGFMAAPALSTLLLLLWWLIFSRIPWLQRFLGLVVFAAALGGVALSHASDRGQLLIMALHAFTPGILVLLLLTGAASWRARRGVLLTYVIACAVVFSLLRVASIGGNLVPNLVWRWTPTPEQLLAAANANKPAEPHETAQLPAQLGPGDWPGFRGAARDGRVSGVTFATDWSARPPKELWRIRVGLGWSSFTVVGDYVFTQEQRQDDEVVSCYRADTGVAVWLNHVKARFDESTGDIGPRATPTFDDGKLFTVGATGVVQCLDAATGAVVWQRKLTEDAKMGLPTWGFASSPLVAGDLVIVFAGGADGKSVIAYRRLNGDVAWTAGDGTHGYSSAQLAEIGGVPQVLMVSGYGIQSFAPQSGQKLWEHQWEVKMNPRVVQPMVLDGNAVLIGTAEGKGTRRLELAKAGETWNVENKWTSTRFRPYFNDFVFHKGNCYGFDGNMLCCMDPKTGELRWKGNRFGGQALLLADMDMLLVLSEAGEVCLVPAVPESFRIAAQLPAVHGKTWNHPVVAHGKLFVRNDAEAVCYELPK